MDLSLATDPYGNAYLGHTHHQYQQQQQQQQHQPQHNQQQQLQQQQHHHLQYQYHQAQHPQALSLAPPSGKGFYDLESFEHAGTHGAAHNNLGLGHLGASSSYQPDYGMPTFPAGPAGNPVPSSAAGASLHHSVMNPGQPWTRNTTHVNAVQHPQYSPIHAATAPTAAATHILHSGGYNAEAHPHASGASAVGDHSLQYSSLHGWPGSETHRSQWSQQGWDNCLPPGVEPTASSVSNPVLPPHPHSHTPLQAHPHSHTPLQAHHSHTHSQPYSQAHMHMYRHLQQHPSIGMNVWTPKPAPKFWPKRKPANKGPKKIPVAKTTATKESGAARGLAPENGPGWCFVCQRNCVTEVALKQHLEGKQHKRQAELQKDRAELAAKAVDENGGGVASMLEKMWVQVSMMGKTARVGKAKKKPRTRGKSRDVKPTDVEPKADGEQELTDPAPTDIEPKAEEGLTTVEPSCTNVTKVQETVQCDVCGVECNTRAVLEIHFGGKKHAARMKKLQESGEPCITKPTSLVGGQ